MTTVSWPELPTFLIDMIMFEIVSMWLFIVSVVELPRRFLNTRNHALIGKLSETNTAKIEVSHITSFPAAAETAQSSPCRELGLLFTPC